MPRATYSTTSFRFHRYTGADFGEHLLQGMGAGDGIPVNKAGTNHNSFEAEAIHIARINSPG